jgi:hypothetical protein
MIEEVVFLLAIDFKRSGRLRPSRCSRDSCSAVGSVSRRKRISRPSVVGSTMSALCSVDSNAGAFIGEGLRADSRPTLPQMLQRHHRA